MADKDSQNIGSQIQTTQGNNSPNVGRDCTIFNIGESLVRSPSIIGGIIQSIVPYIWNCELQDKPLINEFEIKKKIDYNGLLKYKQTILGLGKYEYSIEYEFENLEQKQPGLKTRFLSYINSEYKKITSMGYDADKIFDVMIELIKEKYNESSNNDGQIYLEDIQDASQCIIGRSFIQCKVLEAPPVVNVDGN